MALIVNNLFITDYCAAQSQRFILNQRLYQNMFYSLDDTSRILIGSNYQINDFKGFDGSVVQLGTRFRPGAENRFLKSLELGLNVNGYFNQDFFYFRTSLASSTINDYAWDGYNASLFIGKSFMIKESKFFISVSPGVNIIKKSFFQYTTSSFSYVNKSSNDKTFAGDFSITWRYKNFETYANYYTNPILQTFVDWGIVNFKSCCYLLDTTKTYYFRAWDYSSSEFFKFYIDAFKYGVIYHSKIKSHLLSIYYYSNLMDFAIGVNFTYKRFIINPEYILYPYSYTYSERYDNNAHQGGMLIKYSFVNGLLIKGAFLYSDRVLDSRNIRSEIGLEIKLK